MRSRFLFISCLIGLAGLTPAAAETLMEKAELWGELHGAAIYCWQQDTNAFGRAAMKYFRRRAGSTARYNQLRDAYGLKSIYTATSPPTHAAGGSCSGFSEKYRTVWKLLRG